MIEVKETTAEWVLDRWQIDKAVVDKSTGIWALEVDQKLKLVFGSIQRSALGVAVIWMHPVDLDRVTLKASRQLVEEGKRRFGQLMALCRPGRDERFAEWCGFRRIGEADGLVRMVTWQS